jgi:cytochrome c biogenesis protein CcmG/thiol:disulfide interchange protein DsbE
MNPRLIWVPLLVFALVLGVVAFGLLRPADRSVRSAMVGKALPDFMLPPILPSKPALASATFRDGRPRIVNVFASWCIPCVAEAPQLMALKDAGIPVEGIAIRDTGPAIAEFLARNGDPYERIGSDPDSSVQLALGSSGVPETFVIDGRGRILLQHIGEIRAEDLPGIINTVRSAR